MSTDYIPQERIEQYVEYIHSELGFEEQTKIDPVIVAQELGFIVYQSSFSDDISGMVVNSNTEKAIYINKDDAIKRQRFTIAHEIGHIILHHENMDKEFKEIDFRSANGTYDLRETQANSFAAALLMPREKSKRVWELLVDVDDFADAFHVSKQAAAIRLMNLGLL